MNIPDYEMTIAPYISGTASTCSYCDRLDPLILVRGEHAYVTLAIGQIVEGYLQVCSSLHRTAATGLDEIEVAEFAKLKRVVREAFVTVYGTPGIAFEHGKAGSCLWIDEDRLTNMTELCYHTHIHMLPVDIDIRERIERLLPKPVVVNSIEELRLVQETWLGPRPYLYFEDTSGVGYVYSVDDEAIPRQFLRTCVADALGVTERADWMKYPGVDLFAAGKAKLQPALEELILHYDI